MCRLVPNYPDANISHVACSAVGVVRGQGFVDEGKYLNTAYHYYHSSK